jgi:uncharacterized protein with FMN-binding domain
MKGEIIMKGKSELRLKRKTKGKMGWMVVLIIIAFLGIGGVMGWLHISKEHTEAGNLRIDAIDFSKLNNGIYIGEYAGGMYKWRTNKVQVTISSGKVADIKVLEHKKNQKPEIMGQLYNRVIKAQSLQVDTISGATLDTKAYLKSVENALIKAEKR